MVRGPVCWTACTCTPGCCLSQTLPVCRRSHKQQHILRHSLALVHMHIHMDTLSTVYAHDYTVLCCAVQCCLVCCVSRAFLSCLLFCSLAVLVLCPCPSLCILSCVSCVVYVYVCWTLIWTVHCKLAWPVLLCVCCSVCVV
jgi:hypothetical protein